MKILSKNAAAQFRQKTALVLAVVFLSEAVYPTASMALTSGPKAPEFSSFEPVTTTNMVNEFTGDFTYNIPVINIPGSSGGGYAMSLSYHSGETVESEASWVGYGMTLNAGAMERNKRGFADDTKSSHTYINDVPNNWTISTGASIGNIEIFSFALPISVNASIRYNNYRGFGYTAGAGISYRQGLVSLGYSVSDGSGSFSAQVNPATLLSSNKDKDKKQQIQDDYKDGCKDEAVESYKDYQKGKKTGERMGEKAKSSLGGMLGYGMHALSDQQHPGVITPYEDIVQY